MMGFCCSSLPTRGCPTRGSITGGNPTVDMMGICYRRLYRPRLPTRGPFTGGNPTADILAGCGKTQFKVALIRDSRQLRYFSTALVAFGKRPPVLLRRQRWMSLGTGLTNGYGIAPN